MLLIAGTAVTGRGLLAGDPPWLHDGLTVRGEAARDVAPNTRPLPVLATALVDAGSGVGHVGRGAPARAAWPAIKAVGRVRAARTPARLFDFNAASD